VWHLPGSNGAQLLMCTQPGTVLHACEASRVAARASKRQHNIEKQVMRRRRVSKAPGGIIAICVSSTVYTVRF
jgi:hypothetical protein